MNKIKKSALLLLLSSSLLLSGCEMISAQEYNKAENFSADIGVTGSESAVEEETAISDTTNKTVGIVEEYPDFDVSDINKIQETKSKENNETDFNINDWLLFNISNWEFKDVRENIFVNDVNLPLPCNTHDLPKGISINNDNLFFNSTKIGTVEIKNDEIITYIFNNEDAQKYNIIVGKINPNDTMDNIVMKYGESNDSWSVNNDINTMLIYRFFDGALSIGNFDDTANYDMIAVSYRIYEEEKNFER